ncbi:MAG: hypothetical protein ACPG49_09635, partial [Chitinophagales bacterium]
KKLLTLVLFLGIGQSILAYIGFYQITNDFPPRFILLLPPSILLLIYGLQPKQRKQFTANHNLRIGTFLHTVRVPVEITLYYLFIYKMVPELMTFEGRNFDILAGITAPIVVLFYLKNKIGTKGLLIWNIVCLGLVSFVLLNGVLSSELPFQLFAFEQPNRGMSYFPFILLPAIVVPMVIFTHLIAIFRLLEK